MTRVGVTVEQFWHKVPGGTGWATARTLQALTAGSSYNYIGLAARHGSGDDPQIASPVPTKHARLPRPVLYEAWLRSDFPSVESIVGHDVDVVWASAMVAPPTKAPVVVTVNDLDFLDHPEWLSRRGRGFFPRAWETAKKRADLIVCPSQTSAESCEAQGVNASKIRVVPLGVEAERVSETDARRVSSSLGLPREFALWVGTVEPRKNLKRVVEAVGQVEGLHLAIVGPDGWSVDQHELTSALDGRIHMLGQVGQRTLASLYAAAKLLVFPSLAEGFGLPVLEAMAQGTPVVTSSGTATADAARGAALLVDPTQVDQIAQAIRTILSDQAQAELLIEKGLRVASASTWATTAKGYHQAFSEVAR